MNDHNAQVIRGFADLRGTASNAARRRGVRKPVRRSGRTRALCEALIPRLDQAHRNLTSAIVDERRTVQTASGVAQPPLKSRTSNMLTTAMGIADAVLVSGALAKIDPSLSPALALSLAAGIGISLIALGKKLGNALATFDRLHDQSARWGVVGAVFAAVLLIGSAGLTLLRMTSPLAWPLLAIAVPVGSAALTWLAYSPLWLAIDRANKTRRRAAQRHTRILSRVDHRLATTDRLTHQAEVRFRACVGRSLKRAILDGSLRGDDLDSHGRILEQLCQHHLAPRPTTEIRHTIDTYRIQPTRGDDQRHRDGQERPAA